MVRCSAATLTGELDLLFSGIQLMLDRPEPFKFIKFPPVEAVGLNIIVADDGETVSLSVKKPVKGVILDVDGEDVKWSDQALDLVPGDAQQVRAAGLNGRKIKARFLGDGSA